jgi:riboflavin synthase
MNQTLELTALGRLEPGSSVNLEPAVRASDRLGGHIVQGHVDATGAIVSRRPSEHWELVEIRLPDALARYVVP